jgi:hypothetical protein
MSGCALYQELTNEWPLEFRKKLSSARFYVSGECYSREMKNPTRKEAQACQLTSLLLFFPVLLFCTGAYPAKQKVVKEDGIKYWAAQSVSDEAFKRTQFVGQQMTSHSPEIREKMVASGFAVEIIGKDQVLSDLPDYAYLKGRKTRDGRDFDTGTKGRGRA